ncbi:MAG: PQQ-dependent dehydrogenase, methanol/ethanol family [Nitrospinota bacterium]|nr:MAG: PQQ-dependent dehydrogenase, methanol/ethanol family [Nitrospinota bacterium]
MSGLTFLREGKAMKTAQWFFRMAVCIGVALAMMALVPLPVRGQPVGMSRLLNPDPNDWPMYHRTYKSWRYSPLSQINKFNVSKLSVAWVHQPGTITQGLESTPIVVDGVLYYSASYNRVFALDAATGKEIWHYYPKLDPVVDTLFFQPFNRGVAVGLGKVYMGTLDGRVIALNQRTGEVVWETQVLDTKKCSCNFTAAPLVAKDKVYIGQTAGELPIQGKIFALNAHTGEIVWEFNTIKEDDPNSWGGDSAKYGGGGGWMTGSYDPELDLVFWGTSNPAPDYDWGGARPGNNLYTSSVVALDADTGELKWYYQEIPHDDWDYDSALGEIMFLDRNGKKLIIHQNKSGFVFVYDRVNGKLENVWPMIHTYNFVKTIDPKTGELIGRRAPRLGGPTFICPWIAGGRSWNSGSYNPKTGLWYNIGIEACEEVTVEKQTPITEPSAGLFFGGDQVAKHPPNGEAYGHLDAVDPVTGKRTWSINFKYPPLGSVLSTAGGLVFLGDVEGVVHAYDADTGGELWSFRTGSGHRGGIISYAVNGKQYIVVPSGLGSLVLGLYPALWPEVADFPAGAALFAFTLK